MRQPPRINATLTGFIIGMILVAMFGSIFGLVIGAMNSEYSMSANNTFEKSEDYTLKLENSTEAMRDPTNITQLTGILDVIGGYFSAGYSALKTAVTTFDLFDTMLNDASGDFEEISFFKTYLFMIIAALIFVGIVITVLVKMRM